jgi:hypothetical protein
MMAEGFLGPVIALSVPAAVLFTLFAGLQRIPWRYAVMIGIGSAAVIAMASFASSPGGGSVDGGTWVLLGAIAGGIVIRAYERGMAQRRAMIDRILHVPGTPGG